MKKVLFGFAILSIAFSIQAQNCTEWVETKYDEVAGIVINSMKDRLYVSKDGHRKVGIFVAQKIEDNQQEIVLTIDIKDGGCINNQDDIIFLFTDGTRLRELNHGSSNCDGFAMLNIGIQDYYGKTIKSYLEEKKIKTLRIYTNDSFVQVDFSEENQDKLINTLTCLE